MGLSIIRGVLTKLGDMIMNVISIANQKGGCGKTTVAINLSSCLALKGKRTLLVDMDPQGHSSVGLAVPDEQIEMSIYDVLASQEDKPLGLDKIVWQISKNFDLAPSTVELAGFEQQFAGVPGRELKLAQALENVKESYDYCIIDCPPSVGLLTFNALRASTGVIIPVETGYFSLHGLEKQLETLKMLEQQCGQELIIKVLPNLYDVRTRLGREMLAEIRKRYGEYIFKSHVHFNIKLKESASLGQAINEYDSSSTGFKDFSRLADEVIGLFEPVEIKRAETLDIASQVEELAQRAARLLEESTQVLGSEPKSYQRASAEKKLEMIYGVTQTPEGVKFLAKFPEAKEVAIAGDFNNWSPDATLMNRVEGFEGDWELLLPLDKGRYQYRYVVDGVWQHDPYNNYVESNPFGELNSVLEVE